jgi:hypothetical protein
MSGKTERFYDKGERIYDFGDEFLIVCPKCALMAKVIPVEASEMLSRRKLICSNCGYNKPTNVRENTVIGARVEFSSHKNTESYIVIGGAFDWYFREPLWLQTECSGETLWAYNKTHLEFIENYVGSLLRERMPNINKSLASRLPQWIKSAKNRDQILKAIANLKEKLNGKS